jgi:glutamate dehydrogenase (NAD(P)+)
MRDELGPEVVLEASDPATGMQGFLVVDNSVLGPSGGGCRLGPSVTRDEVAALARGMTYKFGIFGLPRGGCKSGIVGDPAMPADQKRDWLRAFGNALGPLVRDGEIAVGPDMGVTIDDVTHVYAGARAQNPRIGLFSQVIDGDPAGYHLTGYGVVCAADAALAAMGRTLRGATVAIEGFGQVGAGTARYAAQRGARIVAVSTVKGAIHDPGGLDVDRLLALRREQGDDCVPGYGGGESIDPGQIYYLDVDVLVPGARPYVLNSFNSDGVRAALVCPAANIAVTDQADEDLLARGIVCLPDFVSNSGGMLSSLVDIVGGRHDQAFTVMDRLIPAKVKSIVSAALARAMSPLRVAQLEVRERIRRHRASRRPSFEEARDRIREILLGGPGDV